MCSHSRNTVAKNKEENLIHTFGMQGELLADLLKIITHELVV